MAASHEPRIEVELKVRVDDAEALTRSLQAARAELRGTAKQVDTYFSHPSRDFAETDEALRLREVDARCTLTYKGPKFAGETKSRVEMAVNVSDAGTLQRILAAVGFEPVATVAKRRERYTYEDMEIAVDDVEHVGVYAEIEAVVPEADREQAGQRVMALAKQLGLTEVERRSYLEMLLAAEDRA